jgi:sulfur carrier protein
MIVSVNGDDREVVDGATVARLILDVTGALRGSAAVIDGEVVPRSRWDDVVLAEGAVVELITAVQGG